MQTGAITNQIDLAQLMLYAFWIFLAGLIYYLRREDKREGYPLESDRSGGRVIVQGFPRIPPPKTFILPHGGVQTAPRVDPPATPVNASPVGKWPGAPLEPLGDPMLSGVGPGAYANRADAPDMMLEGGLPKIVPLRLATGFSLDPQDPDPRGMTVFGADHVIAGTVNDVWVDRSEVLMRYLEVELAAVGPEGPRGVLVPMTFAQIDARRRRVTVKALMARHFTEVPNPRSSGQLTLLEEDRITAYFAGGLLYAAPSRLGPMM